jgi:hypothetical protein
MVVTSLLTNEFAYRAKDEEGWRSVNRETQEDKYERKITKDLERDRSGSRIRSSTVRAFTNYARGLESTEPSSGGAVVLGLDWEEWRAAMRIAPNNATDKCRRG